MCLVFFFRYQKCHFGCPNQNSKTTYQYKYPPKTPISTLDFGHFPIEIPIENLCLCQRLGRPVQFKFTLTHTKGILETFRKNNSVFSIKFHYKPSSQFSKLQHTERTTYGPGSFLNIEYNSTSKINHLSVSKSQPNVNLKILKGILHFY